MRILDATTRLLRSALDVRARRHEVLSSDLANLDTPGYHAQDIDAPTSTALRFLAQERLGEVSPGERATAPMVRASEQVFEVPGSAGLDGNTVDLDRTVSALAENGIEYAALTRAVQKKLGLARYLLSSER